MKSNLRIALVLVLCLVAAGPSQAATVYWEGKDLEIGGTLDNNWDVGVTANWRLNAEAGAATTFTNGDTVIFKDDGNGLDDNGTVVITAGGVSPASVTFNRGFGKVYNISGGDILTGSMSGIRDDTKNFTRNGSYSFPGGTSITAGGSNFNYAPTSAGSYNFGTGTITVNAGSFNFNPGAAATLTNNFNLGGGTVTANANGTYTGTATITGSTIVTGQGPFPFPAIDLTQNTTVDISRCCGVPSQPQFKSDINDPTFNLTLANGGNVDWSTRVGAPTNAWNVKNITKTGGAHTIYDGADKNKFFGNLNANGGRFTMQGGPVEFQSAGVHDNSFSLTFKMAFDPQPAVIGGANQFGTGFLNLTTLNVDASGVLMGKGTVSNIVNLGGSIGTYGVPININVNNGGTVAPGLSVGILNTVGNMAFAAGSTISMEVTGGGNVPGVDHDQLKVSGNITGLSNANLIVDFANISFDLINGDVITIITSGNNLTGSLFSSVTYTNAPFFWADVNYGNGFVTLSNFNAVPEPSTAMLVGLGAIGLVIKNRRRRKSEE